MFQNFQAMSSFPVNDIDKARLFYEDTLGIQTTDEAIGFTLHFADTKVFIYSKGQNHYPANYFVLSITVPDINQAVVQLNEKGINLEIIEGMEHDEYGIIRGKAIHRGPDVALFKDPAGNLLAVEEN
ncbi:VOC family protein [Oceanobacillus jeddahense]|uniref:VOC family protein n=1 Tax=Oceanobacillus jeddahense TaxID=1462527 RepID=UPI000595C8A5|nr:VOC family protein [Oceanobacillus jeddahense]